MARLFIALALGLVISYGAMLTYHRAVTPAFSMPAPVPLDQQDWGDGNAR